MWFDSCKRPLSFCILRRGLREVRLYSKNVFNKTMDFIKRVKRLMSFPNLIFNCILHPFG